MQWSVAIAYVDKYKRRKPPLKPPQVTIQWNQVDSSEHRNLPYSKAQHEIIEIMSNIRLSNYCVLYPRRFLIQLFGVSEDNENLISNASTSYQLTFTEPKRL